jgi:GT2 family glycosyltransferase
MNTPPRLLAVLVLYNQRLATSKSFLSLLGNPPCVDERIHLLVYDNSPIPIGLDNGFTLTKGRGEYISDIENPGVSKAFNVGAQVARRQGCTHLLFLDQDTGFPRNALSTYVAGIEAHPDCNLFAPVLLSGKKIYSPCRNVLNLNAPLHRISPGLLPTRGLTILNSGMCVSVKAFEEAGRFDESIPLDFADHDFFRRYRSKFKSFVLFDIVCEHGFADNEASDLDPAVTRFGFYCKGARNSIKRPLDAFSIPLLAAIRAIRLSARFGNARFVRLLLHTFFTRKTLPFSPPNPPR